MMRASNRSQRPAGITERTHPMPRVTAPAMMRPVPGRVVVRAGAGGTRSGTWTHRLGRIALGWGMNRAGSAEPQAGQKRKQSHERVVLREKHPGMR